MKANFFASLLTFRLRGISSIGSVGAGRCPTNLSLSNGEHEGLN